MKITMISDGSGRLGVESILFTQIVRFVLAQKMSSFCISLFLFEKSFSLIKVTHYRYVDSFLNVNCLYQSTHISLVSRLIHE